MACAALNVRTTGTMLIVLCQGTSTSAFTYVAARSEYLQHRDGSLIQDTTYRHSTLKMLAAHAFCSHRRQPAAGRK